MSYPGSAELFVDLDTGAQVKGWSDGAHEHHAVEIYFERKDEDGHYYGPGLSRVVVERETGRLIEFEFYGEDVVAQAKATLATRASVAG